MPELNGYNLSRNWFDFCFENPEMIKPNHTALFFFIIEHCNRLGWKKKFGLPTTMAKEAIGIRSYNTYINTLNDLINFGFIKMIEKSKNQYSSNIIALSNFDKAPDKALDKALIKHTTKQSESTRQSIDSINKQRTINKEQINNKQYPDFFNEKLISIYKEFLQFRKEKKKTITKTQEPRFLEKLSKLSNQKPNIAKKILIQSIENGWQGIFELKNKPDKINVQLDQSDFSTPDKGWD